MLTPVKYLTYTLKLSGKTLSFSEPAKYSADFPRPFTQSHNINIYDPDIYPDSGYVCSIHKAYWDYGKRFSFSKVQGTLSFSILLIRINNARINLMERNSFLDETRNHFRELYTDQELKYFGTTPPEKYSYLSINELQWAYYDYLVNDEKVCVYTIPISEQHLMLVNFEFINNSSGKKNNWKEQATSTMNLIMSSFMTI